MAPMIPNDINNEHGKKLGITVFSGGSCIPDRMGLMVNEVC
jgi:hypothetical protein